MACKSNKFVLASVIMALATVGCDRQGALGSGQSVTDQVAAKVTSKPHGVALYGYNYTDLSIGSFEVNGQGGGNLAVSTETTPGGSAVCCATVWAPSSRPKKFAVKWLQNNRWCERTVVLPPVTEAEPEYLEVHFYRDGHIELAATRDHSPPRLKLSRAKYWSRHAAAADNEITIAEGTRCQDGYF